MLTLNEMKAKLVREREIVKDMREGIKESLRIQKRMRADIRSETQINRVVKADHRAAVKAAREAKRAQRVADRIAKAEARLAALRLKASAPKQIRKDQRAASKGVVFSPEQVAALNAERGLA
jgi:hypothetical protein